MHSPSETLQFLAGQMGEDNVSSRAELEARLVPLLCLILRTGQGHPALLHWVRLTLPVVAATLHLTGQIDPQAAAQPLARLLCLQLFQGVRAERGTMVNRQTIGVY